MEQLLPIMQLLVASFIVPLINFIKTKWIPEELAFVTFFMKVILCFLFGMALNWVLGIGLPMPELLELVKNLIIGATAVHSIAKWNKKRKTKTS